MAFIGRERDGGPGRARFLPAPPAPHRDGRAAPEIHDTDIVTVRVDPVGHKGA